MEIVIGVFVVVLLLQGGILLQRIRYSKKERVQYEKNDQLLTETVAKNLDMEKELRTMRQEYEKQQGMEKEIRKMQEQSRLLKHDMKNHTMVILSFLEENKTEEAKQYTSEILDQLNKMYTYVNVGNSLLN